MVLPLVLLGSGLVSGYFTAGNPGRPFQSVQPSDWVAHQPTPQSRQVRYGMGYFARAAEDNALYFLDMGTGQWNRVANFPQELPAQWFGVGASARITGEILPGETLPMTPQETPHNKLGLESGTPYPRLTVKTIEPANRFMTARPASSPSDPPFFEGTLQYVEARQAWLLVQKDTHQVFELSELEPQKIGQWFKSYQWARVRIENAPALPSLLSSPQATPPTPAINILTLEPL